MLVGFVCFYYIGNSRKVILLEAELDTYSRLAAKSMAHEAIQKGDYYFLVPSGEKLSGIEQKEILKNIPSRPTQADTINDRKFIQQFNRLMADYLLNSRGKARIQ